MAIYHCSVQVIGRNTGRSSVAAAAYRSGECLENEYDGLVHDYTKKNWVEYTEIVLPQNAPSEYSDRNTLWNAVEMAEKSKNAQLCREFEVALPMEMSREEQLDVIHNFVNSSLVSEGMIADIAIHNPPVSNDRHQPLDEFGNVTNDISKMQFINPHAHIMVTVRPIDENGKWEKKSEVEYLCKRGNEENAFTAEEYKIAKEQGWEKQYKYYEQNKKVWLTSSEASAKELERVNRTPKTSPYGRKNSTVEKWNSKEQLLEWRLDWENAVNNKFKELGSDIRIDSRSFKDQGRLDEVPTIHMGPAATNMDKRAMREMHEGKHISEVRFSDIGEINREIKIHNKFVVELKEKLKKALQQAGDFIKVIAEKLEGIRTRLIGIKYNEKVISKTLNEMNANIPVEQTRLDRYFEEINNISVANNDSKVLISKLSEELDNTPAYKLVKRSELRKSIEAEKTRMDYRNNYCNSLASKYGFESEESLKVTIQSVSIKKSEYENYKNEVGQLKEESDRLLRAYQERIKEIPANHSEEIIKERDRIRPALFENLKNDIGINEINTSLLKKSTNEVDDLLLSKNKTEIKGVIKKR